MGLSSSLGPGPASVFQGSAWAVRKLCRVPASSHFWVDTEASIAGLSPLLVFAMASIAATMETDSEKLFATTACALIISAVATGVCCLLIGRFRLANLLRFIPYPVAGGFVAGIGGAVCLAAMSLMSANPDGGTVSALLKPTSLWTWLPGFAYGIALYGAMRRWRNPIILPTSVVLAIGAYHLALSALGLSGDEARAAGLLLTSTAQGNLWPALWPADLVHVDWSAMVGQLPNMLTLVVIALICVIMNIAGLEVATDADLAWDREFQATGVASIAAGLGGGTVATVIVPASLRSKLFRATTRLTGVTAACVIWRPALLYLATACWNWCPTRLLAPCWSSPVSGCWTRGW